MSPSEVVHEFEGARFGDARLDRRLVRLAGSVSSDSERSFPKLLSESELEAAYRFLNNERVDCQELLAPHRNATLERARGRLCVIAHDTTTLSFRADGKRQGLGTGSKGSQVLHAHVALAVDGTHNALGVVAFETFSTTRATENPARWREHASSVGALMGPQDVIHVMDREADQFQLLSVLKSHGQRYVVRSQHDRRVLANGEETTLRKALSSDCVVQREVQLGARTNLGRGDKSKRTHPQRQERGALLSFSATTVTARRPNNLGKEFPDAETLNVVRAWEDNPPEGESAVEWILLTTEQVETADDILKVVDIYTNRWVVEEFFKALKSGCAIEARQLETEHALTNAVALFVPVAWSLLSLRTALREAPRASARELLSPQQLAILRESSRKPLSAEPSIEEAVLAIAALGGHLKRNGAPGWLTLRRGWDELATLQRGFLLALNAVEKM